MIENWKKNIALFLGGQAISLFGSMLVQYAISWYVILETQSGSMMTVMVIMGFLPTFLVSPFGGVLADRYNRKYLINIADASIALATLALAVCFLLGYKSLGLIFVLSGVRALGAGVQTPAVSALIPQLVPEEHLVRVNGINSAIQSIAMLGAPALSGIMLTLASIESLFFIDVATAAIGISIVFFWVKAAPPAKKDPAPGGRRMNYWDDLKEGFAYIGRHGYVKRICLLTACFLFAAAPMAFLTPLQVTRNFGADIWRLTAIEIAFVVGMILGGVLMSTWGGFKNRVYSMALSCALTGIGAALLGILNHFTPYLICMGMLGLIMSLYNAPSMAVLQATVEEAFMGRVFGVFTMISSMMMPLGMLVFGPLGDLVKIDALLMGTGAFIFLLSFSLIASKTLRESGNIGGPKPAGETG
ncbi:MAG: MFS transporter [Spirochaetales bacterium]|jgi:DHA3 family macrolide efflux protein-like MFS transporter|nr:MFS transporter [Spirochaetales bacterium]